MKKFIRKGVFETNSSSTHSLVISEGTPETPQKIPVVEVFSDSTGKAHHNCVVLTGGEFGWGYECYHDAETKANYLAVYVKNFEPSRKEMFEEVLKKHTGAEEIVYDFGEEFEDRNYSYIDHQSSDVGAKAFESTQYLENFIFNPESYLILDNDNN